MAGRRWQRGSHQFKFMISVIICSAKVQDLKEVKQNIAKTIGVPYEIIAYDNSDGKRGICEVYNAGARQAQYDILCFMHEDIEMKALGWGSRMIQLFSENPEVGLVGVAGGGYKSVTPSGWYNYDIEKNGGAYSNVFQGYKRDGLPDTHDYNNPKNEAFSKVACVDGCWLCMPKSVWQQCPFDEKLLKHFHGYDLDISLSVNQYYDVAVTFDVPLRHFSEGNYDHKWFGEMLKVHEKWSHILPIDADHVINADLAFNEKRAFRRFLQNSVNEGISRFRLIKVIWNAMPSRLIGLSMVMKLCFALVKMEKKTPVPRINDQMLY